jgi:hypothetical protein
VVAVHVAPARLDHTHARIAKVRHARPDEIGLRKEVRVEDGDEVAARRGKARFERARLVSDAVGAVQVDEVGSLARQAFDMGTNQRLRFVGRVVEDLDFETIARIVHAGDGFEKSRGDGGFVEEGELDGHEGQLAVAGRIEVGPFVAFEGSAMPPAEIDEMRPMKPVGTESSKTAK